MPCLRTAPRTSRRQHQFSIPWTESSSWPNGGLSCTPYLATFPATTGTGCWSCAAVCPPADLKQVAQEVFAHLEGVEGIDDQIQVLPSDGSADGAKRNLPGILEAIREGI